MDINSSEFKELFLNYSEISTGFEKDHLSATGQVDDYISAINGVIGSNIFCELLEKFGSDGIEDVLTSDKLGPIAKNIIKLWYTATWEKLPAEWSSIYGEIANDSTVIVSSRAYTEGLVWSAIGANPPGAKAPGYATWVSPPSFPS
ncbi:MAG: hypothetical protein JAY94_04460 [Candidatus Thiodiazotropha endolucinida]|nr:hypothetical protein [Candidatus Thiodiazotropha taylori]MCW4316743.1 hypothetical protein [Candidatus Thiodiazotropha taylori]